MASDAIFQPLRFRSLTVKNRLFRSNVSGRFDNYDGSGNQGASGRSCRRSCQCISGGASCRTTR